MEELPGTLDIGVGAGGWVIAHDQQRGVQASVRFDLAPDGRLYPTFMYVEAHDAEDRHRELRGVDLRTLPLAAIDAAANSEPLRDKIVRRIEPKWDVVFRERTDEGKVRTGPGRVVRVDAAEASESPATIEVPDTRPYPDEFYATVAAVYTRVARSSQRPASDIAETAGVPVKAVHRWVAEARRRGHLAPGRRGKAG